MKKVSNLINTLEWPIVQGRKKIQITIESYGTFN